MGTVIRALADNRLEHWGFGGVGHGRAAVSALHLVPRGRCPRRRMCEGETPSAPKGLSDV